jgi:hypothetical protein
MYTARFRQLYHGTAASCVASIRQKGLRPLRRPESALPEFWAMLTTCREEATGRALATSQGYPWAVIMYRVPEEEVDAFLHPKIMLGPDAPPRYALRDGMPLTGRMIAHVFEAEASTFPPSS